MARSIFQIERGELGLAIVSRAAVGYSDAWQAPGGATLDDVTIADYSADSDQWSCQIVGGSFNGTPDTTTADVPATWCEAGESIPTPAKTSWDFSGNFLQDINVAAGLNAFLFEHDTSEAYLYASFDGGNPPRLIGRVRIAAATIGGNARENLTADFTLPLIRKPDAQFGTSADNRIISGAESEAAAERADAAPGDSFPADPDITASDSTNAAKLAGEGFVANPATAWTTGQAITIGSYQFNWTGSAWAAGAHA